MTKKILIVENEVRVAEALDRRFRSRGYVPVIVRDKHAAIDGFDEHRPDLVVISLTLDDNQGPAICRDLRSLPLGALVPILLMGTGQESVGGVTDAISIGADHYFAKPNGLADLLAKVVTYIGPGAGLDLNLDDPADVLMPAGQSPTESMSEWSELGDLLRPNPDESVADNNEELAPDSLETTRFEGPTEHFGLPPVDHLDSTMQSAQQPSPVTEQLPPVEADVGRVHLPLLRVPVSLSPALVISSLDSRSRWKNAALSTFFIRQQTRV